MGEPDQAEAAAEEPEQAKSVVKEPEQAKSAVEKPEQAKAAVEEPEQAGVAVEEPDPAAVGDVHALLEMGVPLERLVSIRPHGLDERQLQGIAKAWFASGSGRAPQFSLDVASAVLERSKSAAQSSAFCDRTLEGLEEDAPEELQDPLTYTMMTDPVVLSSGVVVDRSTALDAYGGELRFHSCPFTRERLKKEVYPLLFLKARLVDFAKKRLEHIFTVARTAMADDDSGRKPDYEMAGRAVEVGCRFLRDVGFLRDVRGRTYRAEALRFTKLKGRILQACAKCCVGRVRRDTKVGPWAEAYEKMLSNSQLAGQPGCVKEVLAQAASWFLNKCSDVLEGDSPDAADGAEKWLEGLCGLVAAARKAHASGSGEPPALCPEDVLRMAKLLQRHAKASGAADRAAAARTAVFQALRVQGAGEGELEAFLRAENVRREALELVLKPPAELRVLSKVDTRSTGEWQLLGTLDCAGGECGLDVSCRWQDQGWGNKKGCIRVVLLRGQEKVVTEDMFGTYGEPERHGEHAVSRRSEAASALVQAMRAGDVCRFEYCVGGGGGHQLTIKNFFAVLQAAPVGGDPGEPGVAVAPPPAWMQPVLGLATPASDKVEYEDSDGDLIQFKLEDGQLIKYVNGHKKVGSGDTTGVVTALRRWGRSRVNDQHGWGGDCPQELLGDLADLADRARVQHNLHVRGGGSSDDGSGSESDDYQQVVVGRVATSDLDD